MAARTARWSTAWERAWTVGTGVLVSFGLLAAVHHLGPAPAVGLFLTMALMGAIAMLAVVSVKPEASLVVVPCLGGAAIGAGSLVLLGWWQLLGLTTVLVVLLLVGSSPSGWALARRWRGPRPPEVAAVVRPTTVVAEPVAVVGDPGFVAPEAIDDADICLAWCSSFVALQRASTPAARLRIVEVREVYLDLLERRDPEAFATWLASGARAAGHPPTPSTGAGPASEQLGA